MGALEIVPGIYDVGVTDWNIRDFHGYSTYSGTTYNAFLIVDEKVVLIDTVKKEFGDQLLANIAQVIDPERIDLVVSNHTEMDHSGSLLQVMHRIGAEKPVYCSKMGLKNLGEHFSSRLNYVAVENGGTLNIGRRTLSFLETRMLHWPDSMFTYVKEDRILFSSDAFGQHWAGPEKFDDDVGDAIMWHAQKYFANILLLYAPKILKLLDQVKALDLPIDMICPDHGILWRSDPGKILAAYERWSRQETADRAVVIYDTMWQSTRRMAEAIAEGIAEAGVAVKPIHIRSSHRSDIMTEIMDAKAIVVGSPTLNNQMFPTVSDILTYMKGLKPAHKIGAAFGSFGWSGEAPKLIRGELEAMRFEMVEPNLRLKYVPDEQGLADCIAFGRTIGRAVKG